MITPGPVTATRVYGPQVKAWVLFLGNGTVIKSAGLALVRTGVGGYTITFNTAMNSANWGMTAWYDTQPTNAALATYAKAYTKTTGGCTITTALNSSSADFGICHLAFFE